MKWNRIWKVSGLVVLACILLVSPLAAFAATPVQSPFADVPQDAWFAGDVRFVWEHNMMNGVTETSFAPAETITRAQVATILHRIAGEPMSIYNQHLVDVAFDSWYRGGVFWSFQADIMGEVGYRRFGPQESLTREYFAVVLFRFAEYKNLATGVPDVPAHGRLSQFDDRDQISEWAEEAMLWAVFHDLLRGVSATAIEPQGTLNRAQTAALFHRFVTMFEIAV